MEILGLNLTEQPRPITAEVYHKDIIAQFEAPAISENGNKFVVIWDNTVSPVNWNDFHVLLAINNKEVHVNTPIQVNGLDSKFSAGTLKNLRLTELESVLKEGSFGNFYKNIIEEQNSLKMTIPSLQKKF